MSSDTPLVSVLLPAHNTADYLDEAISSILQQSVASFELIVIDDGSTDDSLEIAARRAQGDNRITVIEQQNAGISVALNNGLKRASGRFVARMDGDDIALPSRFAAQTDYLSKHPECVAVGTRVVQIDPDGLPIAPLEVPLEHDEILNQLCHGRGSAIVHPSSMFPRNALLAVGGYEPRFPPCEDLDLFLKLSQLGRLANLPDTLLHFRRHPKSATAFAAGKERPIKQIVLEEAFRRWGRSSEDISIRQFYQPGSLAELYAAWTVGALGAGNVRTALKYSLRLLPKLFTCPQSMLPISKFVLYKGLRSCRGIRFHRSG